MTSTATPWHVRAARKYGQQTVLYAALALSAPGEYALAQMAGWDPRFAWLMPAVLSLYAAIGASVAKAQKATARAAVGTPMEREAKRRSTSATWGALVALLLATAAQITEHVITAVAFGPTLWVVVVVSAVPPLVAAHVLHIDPPMELEPAEVVDVQEAQPQEAPGEPVEEQEAPADPESVDEPETPLLVTYREAADALDVAVETVRGWKAQGKVLSYPGQGANSVLVDLRECQSVKSRRSVSV